MDFLEIDVNMFNKSLLLQNISLDSVDFLERENDLGIFAKRGSLLMVLPMTIVYGLLLTTGVVGNICTCLVIARNKYMHTATNYYLFSLAMSDVLLLVMGLPQEMYQLWVPSPYVFGEELCVLRGFTAETSTNASILTITAFTVERYVAICHPLRAHTMSRLSRAVKSIIAIWVSAAITAIPVAYQFGLIFIVTDTGQTMKNTSMCAVKRPLSSAFTVSSFLFFCIPLVAISVLYVLIGIRLRFSDTLMKTIEPQGIAEINRRDPNQINSTRRSIIKMLVAVVVSFFLCWSPFQAQRLMAIYMDEKHSELTKLIFTILTHISGVTYYLSATINPILYQLMSLKFQQAFKDTFGKFSKCLKGEHVHQHNATENSRITICQGKSHSLTHFKSYNQASSSRSSIACIYVMSQGSASTSKSANSVTVHSSMI